MQDEQYSVQFVLPFFFEAYLHFDHVKQGGQAIKNILF